MRFDSYMILKRTLYIFYLNFVIKINSKKIKYVFLYYKTCINYNVIRIGMVIQWRRYIWAWGARSPWKFRKLPTCGQGLFIVSSFICAAVLYDKLVLYYIIIFPQIKNMKHDKLKTITKWGGKNNRMRTEKDKIT